MALHSSSWENHLLDRALRDPAPHPAENPAFLLDFSPTEQRQAFAFCESITRQHSRTFYLTSGLLPAAKRQAVRALYAFCRTVDDAVDRGAANARETLEIWKRLVAAEPVAGVDLCTRLVALAWQEARRRYHIPARYALQLIEGVASDLHPRRFAGFDELAAYSYSVASTVGLMSMHIIGYAGPAAVPYAIKLGVALQMTNILRDVGEDRRSGRLYLPLDELAQFDLTEGDMVRGLVDHRWRAFMRFQIQRVRQLYADAWAGLAMLNADGRFAIAAAAELYRAILGDIERHDFDVFNRRAHLSAWGKIRRLPGIWLRSRL